MKLGGQPECGTQQAESHSPLMWRAVLRWERAAARLQAWLRDQHHLACDTLLAVPPPTGAWEAHIYSSSCLPQDPAIFSKDSVPFGKGSDTGCLQDVCVEPEIQI